VRGLLIVNPHATTTADGIADLVTRSLAGVVDLDVEHTRHRGHAHELAVAAGTDLVLVVGGDGAVNEAVNGVMAASGSRASGAAGVPAGHPPLIGVIPGGGANVFARALGLPVDTAAAIRRVREAIAAESYRTIGLGLAGDRYFTFTADLGWGAEVVHEVDELRKNGSRQSASLFVRALTRRYYRGTDRRVPALTVERDGQPPATGVFMTIVTNRSPWTYLGRRALVPVPNPDFNSGLDLLAFCRLRASTVLHAVGQMMWVRNRPTRGRHLMSAPGLEAMTIRSVRPIAFQVDGEYLGETKAVDFRFVPRALRVVA
jgi:diacylglycerol kinase family enzyme